MEVFSFLLSKCLGLHLFHRIQGHKEVFIGGVSLDQLFLHLFPLLVVRLILIKDTFLYSFDLRLDIS